MKTAIARVCALACLSLIIATPALARPLAREITVTIERGDLDLSTKAGARTALKRIKAATQRACGLRPSHAFIQTYRDWNQCRHEFVAKAVDAFDAPLLTALFLDTRGRPFEPKKQRA